jgi:peptidoglycan-associated lipoprotein
MRKLLVSIALINLLAACATQQTQAPAPAVEAKPAPAVEAPKPVAAAPASASSAAVSAPAVAVDPLNDPKSMLAKRSVYYPFDVYVVQDEDKPTVQAHAGYLSTHSARKVRLEGNCDERGSNEYNLALGQRRADGVKKMLLVGGVGEGQVVTVSYGEEKPKGAGHNETAWAQNRRTDINYNY